MLHRNFQNMKVTLLVSNRFCVAKEFGTKEYVKILDTIDLVGFIAMERETHDPRLVFKLTPNILHMILYFLLLF